jgi:hypothetical protein
MGPVMSDRFDVSLVDSALLAELELTTTLMIAANKTDRHLTPDEVDALLGLPPHAPTGSTPLAGSSPAA